MHSAAQCLSGTHDFTTFRDAHCQAKSPVKSIDEIRVYAHGANRCTIEVKAISFLHRQVRSIVGSLIEVGLGKWTQSDFKSALLSKERGRCGPVAPAMGLYLKGVCYKSS